MTTFKRYFTYRLTQSVLRTVVFTVLALLMCLTAVNSSISYQYDFTKTASLESVATVLGILCFLIPILELSGFKNRRNLDTLYFFPIRRERMALAHYLSGLVQIFVIYTVSFVALWLTLVFKTDCFSLEYMPLYYILSLLAGLVIYSIACFIFGEANTGADGILFLALWTFAAYILMYTVRIYVLRELLRETQLWPYESIADWGPLYAPINNLTVIFQNLIETNRQRDPYSYTNSYAARYLSQAYMFAVWAALGLAAAFGFFYRFKRKDAHLAGEISNSIFGYKILIPLYGYSLLLMYSDLDIMTIIVFALMLTGYFFYRRSFKIKKSDIIIIACGILPMILSAILSGM
ncbi:MAG: hypothetical protein IKJ24_03525 [Clostridia bacterium]|nr:hypothetical protein [Clostridia bacterium]